MCRVTGAVVLCVFIDQAEMLVVYTALLSFLTTAAFVGEHSLRRVNTTRQYDTYRRAYQR